MTKTGDNLISALGLDRGNVEMPIPGERRGEYRRSVEMSGVCEFADGDRMDCKIMDITNSGAQLSVASTQGLPERFTLYILPLNAVLDCTVKWRKDTRVGISFSTLSDGPA